MKHLRFIVLIISIGLSLGCAERLESEAPVVNVPNSPWMLEKASKLVPNNKGTDHTEGALLYASCASCHMADGSGRSDGLVPRIAGQREKILLHKFEKLREGSVFLPVMAPFALALTDSEIMKIAQYVSSLPGTKKGQSSNQNYAAYCSSCHGDSGQGNDELLAPKLCGQHGNYLIKRMHEIENKLRGGEDVGMVAILGVVDQQVRTEISEWLSAGACDARGESKIKAVETSNDQ